MRIPFPVHIPLWFVVGFCLSALRSTTDAEDGASLCALQFLIHCHLRNYLQHGGRFFAPLRAYVFFYALLAVVVGLIWKAVLGEPGDSNLAAPILTMEVFLGGITAMLMAIYLSHKLTSRRPLLGNLVNETNMQNATVGCMVTGLMITAFLNFVPHERGGILSALAQINRFLPMALILGVIHQIRRTGGRSSISLPVLLSGGMIFTGGLVGFSKEGIFLLSSVGWWQLDRKDIDYRGFKSQES